MLKMQNMPWVAGLLLAATGCAVEPAGTDSTASSETAVPVTDGTLTPAPGTELPATEILGTEVPGTEVPGTEVPEASEVPVTANSGTQLPSDTEAEPDVTADIQTEFPAATPAETPVPTEAPEEVTAAPPATAVPVVVDEESGVGLFEEPVELMGPRPRRRMDIDQVRQSLLTATGGIGWTELQNDGTEDDLFVTLSDTLGKPDYIETTLEDLDPSLIFQKFLADGSRSVCSKLMAAEIAGESHVFFKYARPDDSVGEAAQAVEKNLQYLLLRYHGHNVASGDARLNQWLWLHQSAQHVSAEKDTETAWNAVCVALISHPDFYTY